MRTNKITWQMFTMPEPDPPPWEAVISEQTESKTCHFIPSVDASNKPLPGTNRTFAVLLRGVWWSPGGECSSGGYACLGHVRAYRLALNKGGYA